MIKTKLFSILTLTISLCAKATLVRQVNIEELTQASSQIIFATVKSVNVEGPGGPRSFPSTVIEFSVHETWKGAKSSTVILRQLSSDYKSRLRALIPLPVFKKGESVIVFLPKESRLGMSSPVGLEQGVFRLSPKESNPGQSSVVVNSSLNKHVVQETKSPAIKKFMASRKIDPTQEKKPLTVFDLKSMVTLAVQEQKAQP